MRKLLVYQSHIVCKSMHQIEPFGGQNWKKFLPCPARSLRSLGLGRFAPSQSRNLFRNFLFEMLGGLQMVPNKGIWRMHDQPVQYATVTHSSHCNYRLVCKSIVLVKQDSLCQFSGCFEMSLLDLLSTTFQSPELRYPVWVYLEGHNAVSIKKVWI